MASESYTTQAEVANSINVLRQTFATHRTKDLRWRKWQLKQLFWLLTENFDRFEKALEADLGRHPLESHFADLSSGAKDVLAFISNLEKWTADVRPNAGFIYNTITSSRIRKEPLGVSLIIGAWNFPVLMLLHPLLGAIAAGCCALIKPSDLAVNISNLLVELVPKYLDQDAIRVVTAGPKEMGYILEQKFDHILYTGSTAVGRIVAAAAAKHLTPVVLELGGQDPAIIGKSADIDLAAKRIAWSKFYNGGQICISTNHVFVDPAVHDQFVERINFYNAKFYGTDGNDMTSIINDRNYSRLQGLLEKTSGNVVAAAKSDPAQRRIAPTAVSNVTMQDSLLSQELFGPILPIVKATVPEAIRTINSMPRPLALYVFSRDRAEIDKVLNETISGGVTVNDIILQFAVPNAPFGGVGDSGNGNYHQSFSVDAFSHFRTVTESPAWLDLVLGFRYPPYNWDKAKRFLLVKETSAPFKKGETLADQRVGASLAVRALQATGAALAVALVWTRFFQRSPVKA